MKRAACLIAAAFVAASSWAAAAAQAAAAAGNGPPLASSWNIAANGNAGSSGDLEFRITPGDGSNPIDITVPVISGASQDSVVRSIQRSLSSQLRRDRYNVQVGENSNVLVSDPGGRPNFSVELVDSGIENLRVAVQSVTPSAPPTVPEQSAPAQPPPNASTPGNDSAAPPVAAPSQTPAPESTPPTAPPPANSPPLPNPAPPPGNDGTGAPASTPPPR